MKKKALNRRKLEDLVSVGPATLKDFSALGIKTVQKLAQQEARDLYNKLCKLTGVRQDPCVEDVFAAAIAQAKDPNLPHEQAKWSYWSHLRKVRPVRCEWVIAGNTLYEEYHDREWGVPVYDDKVHFEFLILEGAQAGLSWLTILKRRGEYAKAFANFDWEKVAHFGAGEIEMLLATSGIIRNRAKVEAAVNNAKRFKEIRQEFGSFNKYIWNFVGGKPLQPSRKTIKEIPPFIAEAQALSKDLQKRGFKFVGPTIMYAHMQATGLINDHTIECFRHKACHCCPL